MAHVELPVVLSPTRAELGARCHRRHVLSDLLERGKYRSPAAAFGTVIHEAAAEWWRNGGAGPDAYSAALAKLEESYANQLDALGTSKDLTLDYTRSLFGTYTEHAELVGPFTAAGKWQEVTIEQRLELPVLDPATNRALAKLSFQQDRVYYNHELDWLVIMDTKTASRTDARWAKVWQRSLQMKLYRYAGKRAYDTTRLDIVIEGLSKTAKRDPLTYLVLPEWSDALLGEAIAQFTRIAEQDTDLLNAASTLGGDVDVPLLEELAVTETSFNYHDCDSYGFSCPFLDLCMTDPEYRAARLRSEYIDVPQDY